MAEIADNPLFLEVAAEAAGNVSANALARSYQPTRVNAPALSVFEVQ